MTTAVVVADAILGAPTAGDTVVVEHGRVVSVTRSDQLGTAPTVRHDGAVIVPGFIDSHLHPLGYAALVTGVSVGQAESIGEVQEILAEAATRIPPGGALVAQHLDDSRLGRLPSRHDLDAVVSDRPVLLYRYCGHVAVANTAVLTLARVDEDTEDPPGGSFDRDDDGRPTGVLREMAIDVVSGVVDPLVPAPRPEQVLAAMESLAAKGIVRIGAMVSTERPLWAGVGDEVRGLCEVATDLPLHVDAMVIADTPRRLRHAAENLESAGGRVRFWGWKEFADGSLGGHTAAMWDPFADTGDRGTLRLSPERFREMARTSLDLGGVVAVHAIGDRAIDLTLDLFDQAIAAGADPTRLRLEHVSVPSDMAIARMASTGVTASVQPSFLASEADWVPPRLGSTRIAYPLRRMIDARVTVIGGSDCPVEPPDPLPAIAAAIHRQGWDDGENLTPSEALDLYTGGPAAHFGLPAPLSPGTAADLVVVAGFGSAVPRIEAVYRSGTATSFRPIEWPA